MAIEFTSDNGIEVYVHVPSSDPSDGGEDLGTFRLDWDSDPVNFARQLRAMANFIEHHKDNKLTVEVD